MNLFDRLKKAFSLTSRQAYRLCVAIMLISVALMFIEGVAPWVLPLNIIRIRIGYETPWQDYFDFIGVLGHALLYFSLGAIGMYLHVKNAEKSDAKKQLDDALGGCPHESSCPLAQDNLGD